MALMEVFTDEYFMKIALRQAQLALQNDEVPIGAVIRCGDQVIAKAHNQTELLNDVTAHAEILAITSASNYLGNKYLPDCTLYVTLEPCLMCSGALRWSQIGKVIYAASDDKHGFMKEGKSVLHPKTKLEYGLLQEESKSILQQFFQQKR